MTNEDAIKVLQVEMACVRRSCVRHECAVCDLVMCEKDVLTAYQMAVDALQTDGNCISRQAAIDTAAEYENELCAILGDENELVEVVKILKHRLIALPSVQPERNWHSCGEPPKHHKNVLVRGIEAIGNVTVHKVMQWDVDRWRPTDYAPSIVWQEWSEI